ncbi:hypothetical protein RIF29_15521 [Crotalaria pallida]|uniref:Uncharacterized protein n=1 Tax=Crotalaria pallida TaxID=3830 RepID=A0AAN9IB89_CROPI
MRGVPVRQFRRTRVENGDEGKWVVSFSGSHGVATSIKSELMALYTLREGNQVTDWVAKDDSSNHVHLPILGAAPLSLNIILINAATVEFVRI